MTNKLKSIAVTLFLFLCAAAVFSVPQIAVLDAILAPGIDPAAALPVTDKIIEEMVNSGKFTVIDRANVEQILTEKEFQLSSGIVRNEEVRQAGEYLGADFVIVANASRVGGTYVISAKMIDVVTGEIARIVGKQISGQEIVVAEATTKLEEKKVEVVVETATGGSTVATAQLQELIRTRTHMKRGGELQMLPLVAKLSEQEKMMLYTSNRKEGATTAMLLNWLVPSLGSFLQGDITGGAIELSLVTTGAVMMLNGETEYYDSYYGYWYWDYNAFFYIGAGVLGVYVVYYIVRPFQFVKQWNKKLATVLQVPYLALMDPEANTFSIVPTDRGVDWRFGLNLVSIEY
jgi:TolB-like protein